MSEQYFNGLKYEWCNFAYVIDFNLSDRRKRVRANLMGIECDDLVLNFVHTCCQTFMRSKRFREDEMKMITSEKGELLYFDIRQKDGLKFLFIHARPKNTHPSEAYYDYQEAAMLSSAVSLCLKYMTAAK